MSDGAIGNIGPESTGGETSRNLEHDEEHRSPGQQTPGAPALVVAGGAPDRDRDEGGVKQDRHAER